MSKKKPNKPREMSQVTRTPRIEDYKTAAEKYLYDSSEALRYLGADAAKHIFKRAGDEFMQAGAKDIARTFYKYSGASQEKLDQLREQIAEQPANQELRQYAQELEFKLAGQIYQQHRTNVKKHEKELRRIKESKLEKVMQRIAAVFMTSSFLLFLFFASTTITGNITGNSSTGIENLTAVYFLLASMFLGYGLYRLV